MIRDFYLGKNIFLTGATGFLGKVILERLLSTLGDELGVVFIMIRPKKGSSLEERF